MPFTIQIKSFNFIKDSFACQIDQAEAPHPGYRCEVPAAALPFMINQWGNPDELVGKTFRLLDPRGVKNREIKVGPRAILKPARDKRDLAVTRSVLGGMSLEAASEVIGITPQAVRGIVAKTCRKLNQVAAGGKNLHELRAHREKFLSGELAIHH